MADEPIPADIQPNEGVVAKVFWWDSDGNPVENPRDAKLCEIHEIDPNGNIKRTYATVN